MLASGRVTEMCEFLKNKSLRACYSSILIKLIFTLLGE